MVEENKRIGREAELRSRVKKAIDRFESVFNRPLSTAVLKEFLDYSERENRLVFLRDRVGVLSDADVAYLRNVLKENVSDDSDPHSELTVATHEALEDLSDLA